MISCEQYDYIEIACMYRFELIITFISGESITATAIDTKRNKENQECLVIQHASDSALIVLDQIIAIEAVKANPHFTKITFIHQ